MAGMTDPSSFVRQQLNDPNDPQKQLPQMDPLGAKRVGLQVAGFAPGAGLASGLGMFPKAEGGYEPSLKQNIQDKNYGTAALQGFGMLADVAGLGGVARSAAKIPAVGNFLANEVGAAKIGSQAPTTLSPLGFYSKGAEIAQSLPQAKGTAGQFKGMLESRGVPKAERQFTGLDAAFPDPNQPVTRDQIAEHFQANQPVLQEKVHRNLSTQEREDRRGMLDELQAIQEGRSGLTSRAAAKRQQELNRVLTEFPSQERFGPMSAYGETLVTPGGADYKEALLHHPDFRNGSYTRAHWAQPNIVAHRRVSLFPHDQSDGLAYVGHEYQSDLAQQGRDYGFSDTPKYAEREARRAEIAREVSQIGKDIMAGRYAGGDGSAEIAMENEIERLSQERSLLGRLMNRMPPRVGPWAGDGNATNILNLRRGLYDAAQQGMDEFTWTTGKQQIDRYGLDHTVDGLTFQPDGRGEYYIGGLANGRSVNSPVFSDTMFLEDIERRFGPEAAAKIAAGRHDGIHSTGYKSDDAPFINIEPRYLGRGMLAAYDDRMPKQVRQIFKKDLGLDAQVRPINIYSSAGPVPQHSVRLDPQAQDRILERGFPFFAGAPIAYGMMQPEEEQR